MQQTVPVSEEIEQVMPGVRYGLGVMSRPLPCGGISWSHGGEQDGYMTKNGVIVDGRRSIVACVSTQRGDSIDSALQQEQAASRLIDRALRQR